MAPRDKPARSPRSRLRRTRRTDVAGSTRRLRIGLVLLVLLLVAAGGKLVVVQGINAPALAAKARDQQLTVKPIHAKRGSVVDRNGNPLAFSTEARALYAQPRKITREWDGEHRKDPSKPTGDQRKHRAAAWIAHVLNNRFSEQDAYAALNKDTTFTYFGPLVQPSQAQQITDRFSEIGSEYRAVRKYPGGPVASNIVGAATWRKDENKTKGLLGLEGAKDSLLAGQDGKRVAATERGGDVVIPGTQRQVRPATPGSDIQLTLDSDLQFTVQRKLTDYVHKVGAHGGSAVVMDAKTGKVYSLANDKSFDPSHPDTWTKSGIGNAAVTSPFEPGSVNKIITMAGAIEHNVARPDTVTQVPGKINIADRTVGDAWSHGTIPLTLTGILSKSSNVGTLLTAQKLGPDRFFDLAKKFGLGKRTGIGLPGESPGFLPPRNTWSGSTFANLPIGQGLSMTVLQMAGMFQTIANDGVRVPPRVINSTVGPDGKRKPAPRPPGVRVVSPDTARTVRGMMRGVVQDAPGQQGTGPEGALDGYQIAGKTGTAQQLDPKCGCYSHNKYWITFGGIVPANNPRFVVGIMLDDPQAHVKNSHNAAPLFHDIASYLTQRYQIPLSNKPAPVQTLQVK